MEKEADLHIHTTASDGDLSPEKLVDLALKKNLNAIAITDHDSLGSVKKAIEHSRGKGIEIVSGIELSCKDPFSKYENIDVVGLFVNPDNKELNDLIFEVLKKRENHEREIIQRLKDFGYELDYDEVRKVAKGTLGRPHIAKCLLNKYSNEFKSIEEIFDKLIGNGKKAFVKHPERTPISRAIETIKASGGLAILAHPGIYSEEDGVKIIDFFISHGGEGIETEYPYYLMLPSIRGDIKTSEEKVTFYKQIAREKNILESGGSDYHGEGRSELGVMHIPKKVFDQLKKYYNNK